MRVFGYTRVSTLDQALEGVSLDAQTERIRSWCLVKGPTFVLEHVYTDAGLSGKRSDNRPGLQSALAAVCEARGVLVVYSLSRLSRSIADAIAIAGELAKSSADLVSLSEDINTTSASGKFYFHLIAALAQMERDLTSERTRTALDHKRRRSERVGQIPYGLRLESDGRTLTDDPAELATLTRILDLAFEGRSLRSIASLLNTDHIPAKNGGLWTHTSIRRILNRPSSYADSKK